MEITEETFNEFEPTIDEAHLFMNMGNPYFQPNHQNQHPKPITSSNTDTRMKEIQHQFPTQPTQLPTPNKSTQYFVPFQQSNMEGYPIRVPTNQYHQTIPKDTTTEFYTVPIQNLTPTQRLSNRNYNQTIQANQHYERIPTPKPNQQPVTHYTYYPTQQAYQQYNQQQKPNYTRNQTDMDTNMNMNMDRIYPETNMVMQNRNMKIQHPMVEFIPLCPSPPPPNQYGNTIPILRQSKRDIQNDYDRRENFTYDNMSLYNKSREVDFRFLPPTPTPPNRSNYTNQPNYINQSNFTYSQPNPINLESNSFVFNQTKTKTSKEVHLLNQPTLYDRTNVPNKIHLPNIKQPKKKNKKKTNNHNSNNNKKNTNQNDKMFFYTYGFKMENESFKKVRPASKLNFNLLNATERPSDRNPNITPRNRQTNPTNQLKTPNPNKRKSFMRTFINLKCKFSNCKSNLKPYRVTSRNNQLFTCSKCDARIPTLSTIYRCNSLEHGISYQLCKQCTLEELNLVNPIRPRKQITKIEKRILYLVAWIFYILQRVKKYKWSLVILLLVIYDMALLYIDEQIMKIAYILIIIITIIQMMQAYKTPIIRSILLTFILVYGYYKVYAYGIFEESYGKFYEKNDKNFITIKTPEETYFIANSDVTTSTLNHLEDYLLGNIYMCESTEIFQKHFSSTNTFANYNQYYYISIDNHELNQVIHYILEDNNSINEIILIPTKLLIYLVNYITSNTSIQIHQNRP